MNVRELNSNLLVIESSVGDTFRVGRDRHSARGWSNTFRTHHLRKSIVISVSTANSKKDRVLLQACRHNHFQESTIYGGKQIQNLVHFGKTSRKRDIEERRSASATTLACPKIRICVAVVTECSGIASGACNLCTVSRRAIELHQIKSGIFRGTTFGANFKDVRLVLAHITKSEV